MKLKAFCLGCVATTLLSVGVLVADPAPVVTVPKTETNAVYVFDDTVTETETEEEYTNVVTGEDSGEDFFTEDPADAVIPETDTSEDSGVSDDIACDDNWTDAY